MTRTPIEVADALFAAGNPRAALQVLRAAAVRDRPPFTVRRRLAEIYRAWGYPDEAGRWGIVLEGWTTPKERDRLARSLVGRRVPPAFRRVRLAVPLDLPDTADAQEVLHRLVPIVERKRASVARPERVGQRVASRTRAVAARCFLLSSALFVMAGLVVVIWTFVGEVDLAEGLAAWAGSLAVALLAAGLLTTALAGAIERRAEEALVFAVAGLTAAVVAIVAVAAWLTAR